MPLNSSETEPKTLYVMISLVLLLVLPRLISAQSQNASQLPLQKGHTHAILELKWSPNDKLLLSYSAADGFLNVWQMPQGRLITTIEDSTIKIKGDDKRALRAFTWSDDSRLIATGSENGTAQVWEAETGKLVVHSVVFSPDSRFIATSDIGGEILLWSAANGKLVREFDGGYFSDDALAFSPDGTRLASGGDNQNIIMWDVKTGERLWHILPIRERHRPTATEIAEQKRAAALAAAKEMAAAQETKRLSHRVFIRFSHFGDSTNPAETRLAETGRRNKSLIRRAESEATGIWLRLHNNSSLPINLSTESIYLPTDKNCGYKTSGGNFFIGLCEGSEIGIRFSVLDTNRNPVRYGFDFGGISMLPPNTSEPRDSLLSAATTPPFVPTTGPLLSPQSSSTRVPCNTTEPGSEA